MAAKHAATMTASIAATTDMRHRKKTESLNLSDLAGIVIPLMEFETILEKILLQDGGWLYLSLC